MDRFGHVGLQLPQRLTEGQGLRGFFRQPGAQEREYETECKVTRLSRRRRYVCCRTDRRRIRE